MDVSLTLDYHIATYIHTIFLCFCNLKKMPVINFSSEDKNGVIMLKENTPYNFDFDKNFAYIPLLKELTTRTTLQKSSK